MTSARPREFLTTLYLPNRKAWASRCEMIDPEAIGRLSSMRRLIARSRVHRAVILDGSGGAQDFYAELLAAAAIRRLPGVARVPMVVGECQWKLGDHRLDRIATQLGVRALDGPKVAYCVLTEWERNRFAKTWGIDPNRVFVTHYCYTLSDAELASPVSRSGYVFSGGNSLRDYRALIEAAPEIDERIFLATKLLKGTLPGNVTAQPVVQERFFQLFRESRAVVVPLGDREDRTAGQQTYLNAMRLGKPLIVTDSPGVREYVEDGRTGIVVPPGDSEALARALRWILNPENDAAVERMATAAAHVAETRFSPDLYLQRVLDVADRIAQA